MDVSILSPPTFGDCNCLGEGNGSIPIGETFRSSKTYLIIAYSSLAILIALKEW